MLEHRRNSARVHDIRVPGHKGEDVTAALRKWTADALVLRQMSDVSKNLS